MAIHLYKQHRQKWGGLVNTTSAEILWVESPSAKANACQRVMVQKLADCNSFYSPDPILNLLYHRLKVPTGANLLLVAVGSLPDLLFVN
jgi:hypothetical protein